MHKPIFTDVYADVANPAAARVEIDQVARLKVGAVDGSCINIDQFASGAGQAQTRGFIKNKTNQAAAIKAGIGVGTTISIRRTDQADGTKYDFVAYQA